MIVDDRLETVLRTAAAGTGAMRTQLRQLVDLLARTPDADWTPLHSAAMDRIDSLRATLGDAASAALIGTCTLRSPRLVRHFGAAGPKVALSAIVAARLREGEWLALIPELPVQARGFLRHRRDLGPAVEALLARFGITDFALPLPAGFEPLVMGAPAPAPAQPPAAEPAAAPTLLTSATQAEGIGAIIQRIEAFRRARSADQAGGSMTGQAVSQPQAIEAAGQSRLPFADEALTAPRPVTALDLRLGRDGTVIAADAAHAAALIGLRPFAADPDAPAACDAASIRAARAHRPIIAGQVWLESGTPLAGTWQIDAIPLFAPESGQFLGYQACLRRPAPDAAAKSRAPASPAAAANDAEASRNADRLRQLLHELRTPINAIQGYSELIQQQVMGPTPHQYRSLAAGIASDAARMLAGFEDIERLIALEAGLAGHQPGGQARQEAACENAQSQFTDLADLLVRLLSQLEPVLAPREAAIDCDMPETALLVAMPQAELERPLWRLLSLMASAVTPGERIALKVTLLPSGTTARLSLPLPAALALQEDTALAAGGGTAILGTGFALRLAAAEIRSAGGQLMRGDAGQDRKALQIVLPLLTAAQQGLSQSSGSAEQVG